MTAEAQAKQNATAARRGHRVGLLQVRSGHPTGGGAPPSPWLWCRSRSGGHLPFRSGGPSGPSGPGPGCAGVQRAEAAGRGRAPREGHGRPPGRRCRLVSSTRASRPQTHRRACGREVVPTPEAPRPGRTRFLGGLDLSPPAGTAGGPPEASGRSRERRGASRPAFFNSEISRSSTPALPVPPSPRPPRRQQTVGPPAPGRRPRAGTMDPARGRAAPSSGGSPTIPRQDPPASPCPAEPGRPLAAAGRPRGPPGREPTTTFPRRGRCRRRGHLPTPPRWHDLQRGRCGAGGPAGHTGHGAGRRRRREGR